MQHEDGGPWTHGIIKDSNGSDCRGTSSIIRETKNGRLLTWNMRHIFRTPVITEQYQHEQTNIKNWASRGHFIHILPVSTTGYPDHVQQIQWHIGHVMTRQQ